MSPSELHRHVTTIARALRHLGPDQADNARTLERLTRDAHDVDGLRASLRGDHSELVWCVVPEVLGAVETLATGRVAADVRSALRAYEAVADALADEPRPRRAVPPPPPSGVIPLLRVLPGGLSADESAPKDMRATVHPSGRGAA